MQLNRPPCLVCMGQLHVLGGAVWIPAALRRSARGRGTYSRQPAPNFMPAHSQILVANDWARTKVFGRDTSRV